MPDRHWYLALVGVHPDHSGKGIGSALIRPMLDEADRDGLPCYLETAESSNVGIYEHLGFEIKREGKVEDSNVSLWTMIRQPRAS